MRRPRTIAALLLAALVVAVLLPSIGRAVGDKGPEVGTIVEADYAGEEFDTGRVHRVELPPGALVVRVGAPQTRPGEWSEEDREISSGDRRYLPITLEPEPWSLPEWAVEPVVTVVADGVRTDLPVEWPILDAEGRPPEGTTAGSESRAYFVVVPDEGRHVRVEVEYDGHVQRLDLDSGEVETGVAAGLYEPVHVPAPCRAEGRRILTWTDCYADVQVTPYDAVLGWVEDPGRTWVVVTTRVVGIDAANLPAQPAPAVDYAAKLAETEVRLDGARATEQRGAIDGRRGYEETQTSVFLADSGVAHELTIAFRIELYRDRRTVRGGPTGPVLAEERRVNAIPLPAH